MFYELAVNNDVLTMNIASAPLQSMSRRNLYRILRVPSS
jgi:hypothetical protein